MEFGRRLGGRIPHLGPAASLSRPALVLVALLALATAALIGVTHDSHREPPSAVASAPDRRSPQPRVAPQPVVVLAAAVRSTVESPPTTAAPPVPDPQWSCPAALAYLAVHQAPGFVGSCGPGSALGHYGYTCWNIALHCPDGARIIHIACPAPFVYMNEEHNSWTLIGAARRDRSVRAGKRVGAGVLPRIPIAAVVVAVTAIHAVSSGDGYDRGSQFHDGRSGTHD